MIDFRLTEEQIALRDLTREFVKQEVLPVAAELDQKTDPRDCFSWDIVEKASKLGLRTIVASEELGGAGVDMLTTAMLVEELAAGDLGVSVVFAQTWKFVQLIQELGTKEQVDKFLKPFMNDDRFMLAATVTEPDAGSDNYCLVNRPDVGLQTTAVLDGDEWVINGMKHFISNGNIANLYIVFAKTDKNKGVVDGTTMFLVPRDTPGLSIGRVHDKMGERLANNAELFYDNLRIPKGNQLGKENEALVNVSKLLRASNAYAASSVLGVARAAYVKALDWARTRKQGGKLLIEQDVMKTMLAEMYMAIDVARTYIWRAAWAAQNGDQFHPKFGALPKVFASEAAFKVATYALEMFGGYGIMKEMGIEKLFRDAAVFLHSDGTNQVQKLKVGGYIKDNPPPLI